MYTVGKLAQKFGLSRSTLLYYDSIGLLRPQARTAGDYRAYAAAEVRRLERICLYRKAGLSLAQIAEVLESDSALAQQLEARLRVLNEEILSLREQQRLILGLLRNPELESQVEMSRARWVSLLRASGFSDEDMRNWHIAFERQAPEEHQRFLEFLCIPQEDIAAIRAYK